MVPTSKSVRYEIQRLKIYGIPDALISQIKAHYKIESKRNSRSGLFEYFFNIHGEEIRPHLLACPFYLKDKNKNEPYANLYLAVAFPDKNQVSDDQYMKLYSYDELWEKVPEKIDNIPIFDPRNIGTVEKNIENSLVFLYKRHIIDGKTISNFKFGQSDEIFDPAQTEIKTEYFGDKSSIISMIQLNDKKQSNVSKFERPREIEDEKLAQITRSKIKSNPAKISYDINFLSFSEDESDSGSSVIQMGTDGPGSRGKYFSERDAIVNNIEHSEEMKMSQIKKFSANDDTDGLLLWAENQIFSLKLQNCNKTLSDSVIIGSLISKIENRSVADEISAKLQNLQKRGMQITIKRFTAIIEDVTRKSDELIMTEIELIEFRPETETVDAFYRRLLRKVRASKIFPGDGGKKFCEMNFRKKVVQDNSTFQILSMGYQGEELIRFTENFLSQTRLADLNNIHVTDYGGENQDFYDPVNEQDQWQLGGNNNYEHFSEGQENYCAPEGQRNSHQSAGDNCDSFARDQSGDNYIQPLPGSEENPNSQHEYYNNLEYFSRRNKIKQCYHCWSRLHLIKDCPDLPHKEGQNDNGFEPDVFPFNAY